MKNNYIIVIGGGIAGTAAAYTLSQKGYPVTIIEKNDRLGGRVHSIITDDATFEMGAGFLTDIYTNIFVFLKKNGLDTYLQTRKSRSAVVKDGLLFPLLAKSTLLGSSLVSHKAKLQFISEFAKTVAAWNKLDSKNWWKAYPFDKQSVIQALTKGNDSELVDYLIQPALDGYCYWSAEHTSEAMLLLILKAAFTRQHTFILKCGLQHIPETAANGSEVLLSHEVTQVQKISEKEYEVTVKNNRGTKKLRASGIVCSTTATGIPKVIKGLNDKQKAFFSSIHYSSTAIVAKIYNPKITPPNYAIAYPRKESKTIGAITIVSDIANNKKKNITLVKLFASGAKGKQLCKESDNSIDSALSKAASISNSIFKGSTDPTSRYIQRWEEAIPEFNVGHFQRLKAFMDGEIETDKIVFAGDYIGGSFIEGAFTSGVEAATRLERQMS